MARRFLSTRASPERDERSQRAAEHRRQGREKVHDLLFVLLKKKKKEKKKKRQVNGKIAVFSPLFASAYSIEDAGLLASPHQVLAKTLLVTAAE